MYCQPKSPAVRRYNRRMLFSSCAYVVTLLPAVYAVNHSHPSQLVAIILTIFPALATAATVAVVGLYLKEETDEFQRELLVQGLLWATALTLVTASTWGLLEMLSKVTPLPAFYLYVVYWFFFGLANVPLRMRYRMGRDE